MGESFYKHAAFVLMTRSRLPRTLALRLRGVARTCTREALDAAYAGFREGRFRGFSGQLGSGFE